MQHNILITSAGKRVALVKAFRETLSQFYPNAKIYITDMNPRMAPAAYVSDACFSVPRASDSAYLDILYNICIQHHIGMIVPTIDTELLILSAYKARFENAGIAVIVSDMSFISICRDKRNTSTFFEDHSIRVPHPVDKNIPSFPLFAKPYDGSLSKDLYYIRNQTELTPEILNNPKLIFMEYIDKSVYKEYTVDIYYGKDHRIKQIVPRERIEIRAGEINKGRTCKGYLVDYIKSRIDFIDGCIGCICLQLFYNQQTGDVVGIEINPRFGGGYPLSYTAGANYPELLIREYFNQEQIKYSDDWKANMIMLRYDEAIFI